VKLQQQNFSVLSGNIKIYFFDLYFIRVQIF